MPCDKVVAEEIISKTELYMKEIMLLQLLCEHFVKTNIANELSVTQNGVIELIVEDFSLDHVPSDLALVQPNKSYLVCCQDEINHDKETVTCSNLDCITSVFHKVCVKPPRKKFKNWICTNFLNIYGTTKKIV